MIRDLAARLRVPRKVERIVREEVNRAVALELAMPAELRQESARLDLPAAPGRRMRGPSHPHPLRVRRARDALSVDRLGSPPAPGSGVTAAR